MKTSSIRNKHQLLRNSQQIPSHNENQPYYHSSTKSTTERPNNRNSQESHFNHTNEESHLQAARHTSNATSQSYSSRRRQPRNEYTTGYEDGLDSLSLTSPSSLRFQPSPAGYSPHSRPARSGQNDSDEGNIDIRSFKKRTEVTQSQSELPTKDYIKLEKEITDLKNEVLRRLHKQTSAQKLAVRAAINESSSSSTSPERTKRVTTTNVDKAGGYERKRPSELGRNKSDSKIKIYDGDELLTADTRTNEDFARNLEEEERIIEKNIEGLSIAVKRKERGHEKKYLDLKAKFKELKNILRSYVNRVIDLEDIIKKKDDIINDCEVQIKTSQKKLQKSNDTVEELRSREGVENGRLRTELEDFIAREASLKDKEDAFHKDIDHLRRELNAKEAVIATYENERGDRSSQVQLLKEELEKVRSERDRLERRLEENSHGKKDFESEIAKYKKKTDEEVRLILEERAEEITSKKEKAREYKAKALEYEKQLNKALEEKKFAGFEVDKLLGQKTSLEREAYKARDELKVANKEIASLKGSLDSLKSQFNETYEGLKSEATRSDTSQNEIKKLNKIIKTAETKLIMREKDLERNEESLAKFKGEVKGLSEDNKRSKDYIAKLEDRVSFLQTHQSEELSRVEANMEEFYREIQHLREENKVLKANEAVLLRDVETCTEEAKKYKKGYKEVKSTNKVLEKELRELNKNVREVISERNYEMHGRTPSGYGSDARMEVLSEVQDMIKHHRQSTKRFEE